MQVFWGVQASVAALGVVGFLAFGQACGSTMSPDMGGSTMSPDMGTCTSTSTSDNFNFCTKPGTLDALLACAMAHCASACPHFVECSSDRTIDPTLEPNCSSCLEASCSAEAQACSI